MSAFKKIGFVLAAAVAASSAACAAESETDTEMETPSVALDSLDEQTEGTSYNGWRQVPYWTNQICYSNHVLGSQLIRSSGDSTRGGGACLTHKTTTSCTSNSWAGDQLCTCGTTTCIDTPTTPTSGSAQGIYGTNAWGYCYQSKCYHRPGSQAATCKVDPNRPAGYIWMNPSDSYLTGGIGDPSVDFVIGCMTKTAGPNGACGVVPSVPNNYMRVMYPLTIDVSGCF